ncbi:MAG: hypothetical protein ABR511_05185 [Acidimicrobiales bacterium]
MAVAIVIVGLGASVAAMATPGTGRAPLRVTGPPLGPPMTDPVAADTTTTAGPGPGPTVLTAPPPTRTTTTTSPVARPVTTVPPAAVPEPTRTTTLPVPLPLCPASDVAVSAATGRTSYAPGAVIDVVASAQNRSGHACQPVDPGLELRDGAGTLLGGVGVADMFTMGTPANPYPRWEPGQTLTAPLQWPARCPAAAGAPAVCGPGTYTVTAIFGPYRSAPTAFTIT